MAEPARLPRSDHRHGGVVRPLSRAAASRCSRPGCPAPANATLTFQYDRRHALLFPLMADGGPETYDLCRDHADRTRPPHGWSLDDARPDASSSQTPAADELDSPRTVAVLAAALRGEAAEQARAEAPSVDQPSAASPVPDLYGAADETDPDPAGSFADPADALTELSALSDGPARTVPGARRRA